MNKIQLKKTKDSLKIFIYEGDLCVAESSKYTKELLNTILMLMGTSIQVIYDCPEDNTDYDLRLTNGINDFGIIEIEHNEQLSIDLEFNQTKIQSFIYTALDWYRSLPEEKIEFEIPIYSGE